METDLTTKKCVPCEGGTACLMGNVLENLQKQIDPAWQLVEAKKIERTFTFKDFAEGMQFVNRVATIAEAEGHHPNIAIDYNKVTITLWTHAIGGLSENDFIVAAKIEKVV